MAREYGILKNTIVVSLKNKNKKLWWWR